MKLSRRMIRVERARRRCVRRLAPFVKLMWKVLNPGHPLVWNWHMTVLCNALERVTRGEVQRLIINVPPGSSKSTIVSLMWPCWEWLQNPAMRFIGASYDLPLSTQFNVKRRQIINSPEYQSLLPPFVLQKGQKEKKLFRNSAQGTMRAVSTNSAVTGDHADRLVIDDPLDPEGIYGPELAQHVRWFRDTAKSRFTDQTKAVIVIVMQRLHEEDLSGILLEEDEGKGRYTHISIPAEYDPETGAEWDPRTEAGESFFKARFPRYILEEKKSNPEEALQYSAQYNQRPTSAEGNLIKRDWWRFWKRLPELRRGAYWTGIWDTAYEDKARSDWTVGQVWVAVGNKAYLVDQVRAKMEWVEMEREALRLAEKWPQVGFWAIEERALGSALLSALRRAGVRVKAIKSQSSKKQRVLAVTPLILGGQVYVPDEACQRPPMLRSEFNWTLPHQMPEFMEEMASYDKGKHDDQVDAMAFALGELADFLAASGRQPDPIIQEQRDNLLGGGSFSRPSSSGLKRRF